MKVNDPTIKALYEINDPIRQISKEIDKEILRVLIEIGKGNKVESDLIPFKVIKQYESRNKIN